MITILYYYSTIFSINSELREFVYRCVAKKLPSSFILEEGVKLRSERIISLYKYTVLLGIIELITMLAIL